MADGSSRKRSLPPEIEELLKPKKEKKVRFPKGKKAKPGDELPVVEEQDEDVQTDTDAQIAAKEHALRRHQIPRTQEDTEMLRDISAAEVHYKESEDFIDDGIYIEPFNLDQEKEEGFFDAADNYVEFINENEDKDAWLDNIQVNPGLAKRRAEIANKDESNEDENVELTSKEIAMMKRRMADVLLPGETVLQALRRLKGTSTSKKEKMSAEMKVIFDQLTEDAMMLMENGDYNVYEENKEVFQREAEGYEKLAHARGEGTSPNSGQGDDSFDMFAEDDDNANANPASGSGPVTGSSNQPSESGSLQNDFVYDESSGYYYSSNSGYYYDPSSGLYCSASGQWYSYKEDTMTWEEVQGTESCSKPIGFVAENLNL